MRAASDPFLCSIQKPFLRPDLASTSPPRADAVKVGRRANRATTSNVPRPRLDGGEHGGTLAPVGVTTIATAGLQPTTFPHQAVHARHRGFVPSSASRALYRTPEV